MIVIINTTYGDTVLNSSINFSSTNKLKLILEGDKLNDNKFISNSN